MLTETFGGECPVCGFDRVMMRFGSTGCYHFDACPKCGFAYGSDNQSFEYKDPLEVWRNMLEAERKFLRGRKLPVSIDGIYQWIMSLPNPDKDGIKTVFVYTDEDVAEYKKSKLYKKRIIKFKEKVVFA